MTRRGASLFFRCVAASIVAFGSTGCTPGPFGGHRELEVPVPPTWTGGASTDNFSPTVGESPAPETSAHERWWSRLGGAELEGLVAEALEHNHELRAAAARMVAAEAQARIAGAERLPSLKAGFSAARAKQNFIGLPVGELTGATTPGAGTDGGGASSAVLSSTSTNLGVSFDLTWELDLWGRLGARAAAATSDVEAVEADYRAAQLSLAAQTAKAWFALVEAETQLELARRTLESFEAGARDVAGRYEAGVRSSLDLRLSLSERDAAGALVERRLRGRDAVARQLEVLLGRYPAAELQAAPGLPEFDGPVPAGLPSELVGRRPDVAAAERRVAASEARIYESRAALLPRFSLTASGGTSSEELADLLDGDFGVWTLAGNLLQPIFQGGRLRAGIDFAEAGGEEAEARYFGTVLAAYAEVESALAAEAALAAEERWLAAAANQASAAGELSERRYLGGVEDYVTVLAATRGALEAESARIAVRLARLDARVNLYLALGGGFETDCPPESPVVDPVESVVDDAAEAAAEESSS